MPFHVQGREGFGNSDNPEGVAAKFFRRSILRPDGIVWGGTNAAKEIKRKQRVAFARTPAAPAGGDLFGRHLVLRIRIEVGSRVAFVKLAGGVA